MLQRNNTVSAKLLPENEMIRNSLQQMPNILEIQVISILLNLQYLPFELLLRDANYDNEYTSMTSVGYTK